MGKRCWLRDMVCFDEIFIVVVMKFLEFSSVVSCWDYIILSNIKQLSLKFCWDNLNLIILIWMYIFSMIVIIVSEVDFCIVEF